MLILKNAVTLNLTAVSYDVDIVFKRLYPKRVKLAQMTHHTL